jgi:hypothetical protein
MPDLATLVDGPDDFVKAPPIWDQIAQGVTVPILAADGWHFLSAHRVRAALGLRDPATKSTDRGPWHSDGSNRSGKTCTTLVDW